MLERAPDQVSGAIDGKIVLLSIEAGHYFHMNEVGSRIWALLEKPLSLSALVDALQGEFTIERATCEREVSTFVAQLLRDNLLRISPSPA